MAYSKQTWDTTSYVNPTRMNHIEEGIYNASTNIADNLTTDDSTKALSAKQGKVLKDKIDEVETEVATKVTLKTATGTITTNSGGATNFENIVSNNAKILRVDVLGIQADRMCFLGTWNGNVLGYVFTRDLNPVVNTQLSIRILYYE